MINVRAPSYDWLSVRSWWPATEDEWLMAESHSYQDTADVGPTTDASTSFPKLSATKLQPHSFSLGDTELIMNFPSFVALQAVVRNFAKAGNPPPPPPANPEISCVPGTTSSNYNYQTERDDEAPPQDCSASQVLTGAAIISSIQRYQ